MHQREQDGAAYQRPRPSRVGIPSSADHGCSGKRNPGLTEELPNVLVKLGRLLERRLHHELSTKQISVGQLLVLSHIGRHPGVSRAGIARAVQLTPQAVGGLAAQLLGNGLVCRTKSVRGNPVAFTITDAGCDALEEADAATQTVTAALMRSLRPELRPLLDGASRHLLASLDRASPGRRG